MEKIACVLWKPAGVPDDVFGKGLRAAAPELARLGAMNVRVNVVDEHVAAGTAVRVGRMDPPKAAFVTFWLDEADDASRSGGAASTRCASPRTPRASPPISSSSRSRCATRRSSRSRVSARPASTS